MNIEKLSNKLDVPLERIEDILKDIYGEIDLQGDLSDDQIQAVMDIVENESNYEEVKLRELKRIEKEKAKLKKGKRAKKTLKAEEVGTENLQGVTEEVKPKKVRKRKDEMPVAQEGVEVKEYKEETRRRRGKRKETEETTVKESVPLPPEDEVKSKRRAPRKKEEADNLADAVSRTEIVTEEPSKEVEIQTVSSEHSKTTTGIAEPDKVTIEPVEEQKIHPKAEIISEEEGKKYIEEEKDKKKKKSKEQTIEVNIGGAVEEFEPVVEVVLSDGTRTRIDDANFDEKILASQTSTQTPEEEVSELEEEYEYEFEERRKHRKPHKHLPVPDPEIVEKVRRESEERLRRKREKEKGKPREVVIDKERLFTGKEEKKRKFDKKDKRKGKFKPHRGIDEEELMREAAAAVKEFDSFGPAFHLKKKKKKKDRTYAMGEDMEKVEAPTLEVPGPMTVEQLANALEISASDVIIDLMDLNIMATKNQVIDLDAIRFVAKKHGVDVELVIPEEEEILSEEPDNPEDLVPRSPVVTVMGHVDHGKTSLLDRVRSTNVVATEAGGITQHIAAYEVNTAHGKVVFLDTPGHEAFTQMRARGAKVTDIVVLVVAADDGVQPQTVEAIDHALAAEVPIIVAINKCDKPEAEPDRVRQQLVAYDLIDEAWGGKTIMKNISAKTGAGVDELLELIVLQAQMMELKANPNKKARGTVIEAELSRGFGPVAWVLIQNGTLRVGDAFLCGSTCGKVRVMFNSQGQPIEEAPPSTPVLVTGFEELPEAGESFLVIEDERKARLIAEKRKEIKKFQSGEPARKITLEDFHSLVEAGEQKKLHIIIKADVQGSADVLKSSLAELGNENVGVEIIRASVGEVSESDVLLAQVTKSVIIGFHIGVNPRAQKLAEETGVEIRLYKVIYEVIEDVRKSLTGLLKPILNEVVLGRAEIRKVFRSSSIGNIAGCFQLEGTTIRGGLVRVIRGGQVICEDKIASLKRGKDDVREVQAGYECGIKLEKFEDIQEGDILEIYQLEEVKPSLN